MAVDLTDGCPFWYTQEYDPATSSAYWHTRLVQVRLGGSTTTGPAPPTNLLAMPGNAQVTLNWSASTGAITFSARRRAAGAMAPSAP